jgi:site-specific DNA-methyltransferase (adenine-specific)
MPRVEKLAEGITLYCGDCREILPMLGKVDAVITDPPFEQEAHTLQRRVKREGGIMEIESLPFEAINSEMRQQIAYQITAVCNGWALLFCQAEAVSQWRDVFEDACANYKRAMVWIKPDGMPQYSGDRPGMGYESIVSIWCGKGKSSWNGGGRHGVFTHNKNDNGGRPAPHPTTKPEPLMRELISLFTNSRETILDPFMGSGSTGVAAIKLARNFVGIELDIKFFDIACKRVSEALKQPDMFLDWRPFVPEPTQTWMNMWSKPLPSTESEIREAAE